MARASLQERIESHALGRDVISVLVVAIVLCVAVWSTPTNWPTADAKRDIEPVLRELELRQSWSLFSPNPRRVGWRLEVQVHYTDGTTDTWEPPITDQVTGNYRGYRWRKWSSNVLSDNNTGLQRLAARYVAFNHADSSRTIDEIDVVRRFRPVPAPGDPVGPWQEEVLRTVTAEELP